MAYVELLAKSSFSFLRGGSSPQEMVETAETLGLAGIALCDRDGLYGSARALVQAKQSNIAVVVGAEITTNDSAQPIQRYPESELPRRKAAKHDAAPLLSFLVQNQEGYSNLCRLLTRAHSGLPKGECVLEREWLAEHHAGLVAVVSAPESSTAPRVVGQPWLELLSDVFGQRGDLLFAAYRRLDGYDGLRVHSVEALQRRYGGEVIASALPLYHHKSRKSLCDVLHCIRQGITLDAAGCQLGLNAEAGLRSEAQMLTMFAGREPWVWRTAEVAERLRFRLSELRYQFPCDTSSETADARLARLTWEGARWRYPEEVPLKVRLQLEKELALIHKLNVAAYFLSTWEVVQIARERQILCQGRGSAANSAVCFVLGITSVDPAQSDLLFERFMSAERAEPPDIDVDFEHERREEVIQEIYRRYGRERAAMVSEVICYRGKSALRDVGRVFGLSEEQVSRLSGAITYWDTAAAAAERIKETGLSAASERVQQVLGHARQLKGFPRHLSIHVGGIVLSAEPLYQVAPVEPGRMVGRSVIPWDKDDLESLGFFKIDVLALGMMTAIRKGLQTVFADGGLPEAGQGRDSFDPVAAFGAVPAEDKLVYAMICRADTVGVFQIESRAQMSMLPRLRPQKFYDLVIEVAIVRPGPIQGGMVHPYLRRKNKEEPADMPHECLRPILERTLGVPLFQEQVMQISIVGAGYSGGEADQLRRDMAAWKKDGQLLRHRQRLLSGFSQKGISREFGEALFEQIKGFGDYGFPESHAASFAHLVYVSAWLKAHYPAHFLAALLNSQPMGFYSPSSLVKDAQKHGVEVRPVDVQHSAWDNVLEPASALCKIESQRSDASRAVRLGLRQISGLSVAAGKAVILARERAPFQTLSDFILRVHLRKTDWEALAESGALEGLLAGRRQALWQLRAPRAPGLFSHLLAEEPLAELPALRPKEQLLLDYERLGLSLQDHPIHYFADRLAQHRVHKAAELQAITHGAVVNVAGIVLSRQRPATASGIVFITLEDESGVVNLVVFSGVFEAHRLVAQNASILLARGKLERHVTAQRPDEVGESTPVIHVIVQTLQRLDVPGRDVAKSSRDFH